MDLLKVRHAVAVAREGGFSAAAEANRISQSALTRSIQALEAEYQIRIFDRGRSGAKMTPAGSRFIRMAERLIQHVDSVDEEFALIRQGHAPPVSFGMGPISAACYLPVALPLLVADGSRFRVKVESNAMLQFLLRRGEIEFFVGGVPRAINRSSIDRMKIIDLKEPALHLLVRPDHPLVGTACERSQIAQYPLAVASFIRDMVPKTTMDALGLQSPSMEMEDYTMLAALARSTDYLVLGSQMLVRSRPEFDLTSLPLLVERDNAVEWAIVKADDHELSPSAQRAVELIHGVADRLLNAAPMTSAIPS